MPCSKKVLALLAGTLMAFSALSMSTGEMRSKFSNGDANALLSFPEGGGLFSNLSVTLPRAATIWAASLDIEGRPVTYGPSPHTVDFQNPSGSRAWAGTTAPVPPGSAPSSYESANITLQAAIQKSDDVFYTTSGVNKAPYHLFEFYLGATVLSSFTLTWEGIGFSNPQAGFGSNGASLYIWNNATGGWDFQARSGTGEVPQEVTLRSQAVCTTSYVDSSGFLNAMVYPANMVQNRIETDHVKLDYQGFRTAWPADVEMDVGADASVEWSHAGTLVGKETFSGQAFVKALQTAVNASSTDNVTIPLGIKASAGGAIFLSGLSITTSLRDMPPFIKKSLPSVLMVPEDGARYGVLDLADYFGDDGGAGNLTFSVAWMSDPPNVRLLINGTGLDIIANLTDWNGNVKARLRAADANGQWVESGNLTIEITPVNDAPRLEKTGALTATQGVLFERTFNVSDPDDSAFIFGTNASLSFFDNVTGTITFLPGNKDVGRHLFWVNVTDDEGASDRLNLSLTVVNVNDPPVLQVISDITVSERSPFTLNLNASDQDQDIGLDRLHFSSSSDLFNITAAGVISFTPQQWDVGEHPASVTVTDTGGLNDTHAFTITVLDVNDPPELERPADMTVDEHQKVSFRMNATDHDVGDVLTFKSNTTLFTITREGWANFTPAAKNIGDNAVRITVTDRGGLSDTVEFKITVVNVNDPPRNVKVLSPLNGTTFKQGQTMALEAMAEDADGDALEYSWFADGAPIGAGANLTVKGLKPGKHSIWVEALDGTAANSSAPVEITVKEAARSKGFIPGFGLQAVLLAISCIALAGSARKRTFGGPRTNSSDRK